MSFIKHSPFCGRPSEFRRVVVVRGGSGAAVQGEPSVHCDSISAMPSSPYAYCRKLLHRH